MGRSADVVIIGAGVPGLALALALRERDISTLLLDARRNVENVSRGLTLQPNGLEALEKLGVLDKIQRAGSKTQVFEIRNSKGTLLLEADYGLLNHPQNYLLTVNASELDLALRYRAEESGAEVVWGARFQDLVRNNGQVQGVSFETDEGTDQVNASVVVGADGSQSRVRDAIGVKAETKKYPDSFISKRNSLGSPRKPPPPLPVFRDGPGSGTSHPATRRYLDGLTVEWHFSVIRPTHFILTRGRA